MGESQQKPFLCKKTNTMKFVLSGGGVRGFAHVGVLQAMTGRWRQPSAISATSAGAIVGEFIADGFSPGSKRK